MSNPFVAFSEADSCTACPSNALTTIANDDITCKDNVCPTGMVYLDTFYGCVKKLPNGDGASSATGNAGSLRRAVSDWIAAGGASSSTVVATYGPIEDWDVSEVTNMKYVFYGGNGLGSTFGSFNADLSKWNTGAVTTMERSKCTLSPSLWPRLPLLCILIIRQLKFHRITLLTRFVFCFCVFRTVPFVVVCGGFVFSFLLHPLLLQCLNKHLCSIRICPNGIRGRWQICKAVSVLSLPLSVPPPSVVVSFEYTTTWVSSDHTSHTCCYFCFVCLKRFSFLLFVVGWSFFFLLHSLSCSVLSSICVQSGRVQMEYGGGDSYARQ